MHFFQFDIEDFYPSITKTLLLKVLEWARGYSYISEKAVDIIMQARKTFLFDGNNLWIKQGEDNFDVAMGSWDGAEIADLVGLYWLF